MSMYVCIYIYIAFFCTNWHFVRCSIDNCSCVSPNSCFFVQPKMVALPMECARPEPRKDFTKLADKLEPGVIGKCHGFSGLS